MTGPTSRVLQLLELLQSAGTRTVNELAERLGVDERTVRRDVGRLLDLDIPVESVRGRYGGYRIAAGYRMPPLMLSDDEAVAVVLALLHAQALDARAAPGTSSTAAQTAMSKIRRSLPAASGVQVDTLLRTAVIPRPDGPAIPDASILLTLADAVQNRRPLVLRYRSAADEFSERAVHPYDLVAHSGRWYVVALDTSRGAERTFRVDRIRSARTLPGSFPPGPTTDTTARLIDGFARAERAWHVILRIQAGEEQIRTQLPASVAALTPLSGMDAPPDSPWYRADIHAANLDWVPAVIVALGCVVQIEQPDELRALVANAAARLIASAATGSGRDSAAFA